MTSSSLSKPWLSTTLKLAGVYNVVWGAVVIAFPSLLFDLLEMEMINYPMIWQSVGLVVGVYGVGYYLAANRYIEQWPLVLVGFLGKAGGPAGIVWYVWNGQLPAGFLLVTLLNDIIWLIPFFLMLKQAKEFNADKT